MKQKSKGNKLAVFLSTLYLIAALCLLVGVCGSCYPEVKERLLQVIIGEANSPIREAFGTFADGLADGRDIRSVFAASAEELLAYAD